MHEEDKKWVQDTINTLPPYLRNDALSKYKEVFKQAHDNEPMGHKKMNVARHEANRRLREFQNKLKTLAM